MRKQWIKVIGAILLISMAQISCIEEIDLAVPAGLSDNVVIQARVIMGENSRVEVFAGRLFDFSAEARFALNLEKVTLFDENENQMELVTTTPGNYIVPLNDNTPIKAELGGRYKLRVTTFDNRTFESEFDAIVQNRAPSKLDVRKIEELATNALGEQETVERLEVTIDSKFENNNKGLLWEVSNIYKITDSPVEQSVEPKTCYVSGTASISQLPVLDLQNLPSGDIKNFPLVKIPIDFRQNEGMYFEVKQYSLSPGATKYWESAALLVEREGGLFEDPVGLIQSNFVNVDNPNEAVYGYFYGTQEEVIRLKISTSLTGELDPYCPPPPPSVPPPGGCPLGNAICCDCLIDPGASLIRPQYWVD